MQTTTRDYVLDMIAHHCDALKKAAQSRFGDDVLMAIKNRIDVFFNDLSSI